MDTSIIDTPLAIVERTCPNSVTVRFKPGVCIDAKGLNAVREARRDLAGGNRVRVLVMAPENLDFDLNIMYINHYAADDPSAYTRAMAIVYPGTLFQRLVDLYTRYRKPSFPYRVFDSPNEALTWLADQTGAGDVEPDI